MAGAQQMTTSELAAVDTNGDGTIDATEFAAFTDQAFKTLDVNNDGSISKEEAGVGHQPRALRGHRHQRQRRDQPGGVQRPDQADFAALDEDGNGKLN